MTPIKWDGRERTAERILWALPDLCCCTWGGAPGIPREVQIRTSPKHDWRTVPRGSLVGMNKGGAPIITRARKP